MRYLTKQQVERKFETLSVLDQLDAYKKAFTFKELDINAYQLTRTDCLAMAMGFEKCVSGSGFYEHRDWKDVLYDEIKEEDKDNFKL